MTYVKICGCRTAEDVRAASEAGADFVGLMFAESKRRISVDDARAIVRSMGPSHRVLEPSQKASRPDDLRAWFEWGNWALSTMLVRKRPMVVGVFANASADEMNSVADRVGLDLVQLSGDEPWEVSLLLARACLKVVHIREGESAAEVSRRVRPRNALAVLLDRSEAGAYGGTGKVADWSVAAEVAKSAPVWLAGGLTPENVREAIRRVHPACVDVSSGVETDGAKDPARMKAFVQAVKGL